MKGSKYSIIKLVESLDLWKKNQNDIIIYHVFI
jgi:hypothetical protein